MNIPENKKKRQSQEKITKVFLQLIQDKELESINVTDIVKLAKINRSTFYANYIDIYDLADKVKGKMWNDYLSLYPTERDEHKHSYDFLPLFKNVKENPIFYKTLFKLNFDFSDYYDIYLETKEMLKFYGTTKNMDYHIEFFKAGITAIIKKWLNNDCKETPEEMVEIINTEYREKSLEN